MPLRYLFSSRVAARKQCFWTTLNGLKINHEQPKAAKVVNSFSMYVEQAFSERMLERRRRPTQALQQQQQQEPRQGGSGGRPQPSGREVIHPLGSSLPNDVGCRSKKQASSVRLRVNHTIDILRASNTKRVCSRQDFQHGEETQATAAAETARL